MYLSLWFGIVMAGGHTGCTSSKKDVAPPPQVEMVRPSPSGKPGSGGQGIVRGLRNPDLLQIPKVPPPGARMSYNSVSISAPYVAMTYDDGPHPVYTPRLLDMLRERNIKATFYVIGSNAQRYPQIIRRMLAEGHEIGNHTWNHPALSSISEARGREEMSRTARLITDISGYHMRTMRPPYGATNQHVKQWLYQDYGYPTIMWSVDPLDWKRPGASVVTSRILAGARPGAIILAHDIHQGTVDAMPNTLDGLLSRGFRFVTVSQLLNMENRPLTSAAEAPVMQSALLQQPAPATSQPSPSLPQQGPPAPAPGNTIPTMIQPPGI